MTTAIPMPLKVRRTVRADRDLHDVWLYIRANNLRAADKLIRRLTETFSELATNPELGRARPDLTADLRSFPFGRYNVFYRFDATTLTIVRVLSSYRDLSRDTFPAR